MWICSVSFLLCDSKMSFFGLWTKQDIWRRHHGLYEALRDIYFTIFGQFINQKNKLINQVNSWLINQQGRKELSRKHVLISQSRDYEIKKLDLWTWWHFSSVSLWGDKSHWWHIREKIRCGEGHCSGSNNCSSCKNRLQINPTRLLNMDESV